MDTERVDGALNLNQGSFDGWWVIERAPLGRLLDADVEGTAEEMRAIARAIHDRGHYSAKRCAVDVAADRVYLWSPRNSMCRAVVSLTAADSLALLIDTTLGAAGRASEPPLPDLDVDPTPGPPLTFEQGGGIDALQREIAARWGSSEYGPAYLARQDPQRDAHHALLHITKASGHLAGMLDAQDHDRDVMRRADADVDDASRRLADLVICAARIAETWPGGAIDLAAAVEARLAAKFPAKAGTP